MRAEKIAMTIVGAFLAIIGFGAFVLGGALVLTHATQRDSAGFYTTSTHRFETSTAALVARAELGTSGDITPEHPLGTVRVRATAADRGPIFVGVGPTADVRRWLGGAAYERIVGVHYGPFHPDTAYVSGSGSVALPAAQGFWTASVSGAGTQTLTWESLRGDWSFVVMNADARPGVTADVSVGAKSGLLLPAGLVSGGVGLLLLAGGVLLMLFGVRGTRTTPPSGAAAGTVGAPGGVGTAGAGPVPRSYPARLDARLDQPLSRWLWLVKWFLVIPHAIVLVLLWLAVVPLTVIAGFAILFTGRYPRGIFEFNVGVLRWTWRVAYYAFSAFGTDRYPPFSLASDPTYPADFTVDYPERLSRGLVLVKWWLLAIPHYLVVAIFAGGWAWGGRYGDNWRYLDGGGLIGLLALVAVLVLAFTGRYPQDVYTFVMGMNRWVYRVLAYVLLMRDEYPPFRLDNGGTDPGNLPVVPPQVPPAGERVVETAPGAGTAPGGRA